MIVYRLYQFFNIYEGSIATVGLLTTGCGVMSLWFGSNGRRKLKDGDECVAGRRVS
jgi:hypothetical protein